MYPGPGLQPGVACAGSCAVDFNGGGGCRIMTTSSSSTTTSTSTLSETLCADGALYAFDAPTGHFLEPMQGRDPWTGEVVDLEVYDETVRNTHTHSLSLSLSLSLSHTYTHSLSRARSLSHTRAHKHAHARARTRGHDAASVTRSACRTPVTLARRFFHS